MKNLFSYIIELQKTNQPFVLATVVKTSGSSPGKTGFKILVKNNKETIGTVGGGAIEVEVINESMKRLVSGENGIKEYILSDKENNSSGKNVIPMKCNGKSTIYFEVYGKKKTVYVFGGGHIGHSILYFLNPLPYYKILIDNREEFVNKEKNPFADEYIISDYKKFTSEFNPPENSYVIILTHGHNFDYDILKTVYARKLKLSYIGVIASKFKATSMKEQLKNDLGNKVDLSILHSPIGLKEIGGSSAEEIALSITAEIQSITKHN